MNWAVNLHRAGEAGTYHLHFDVMRDSTNFINPLTTYQEEDIRGCPNLSTNANPNPLYKLSGGIYSFNASFNWGYVTNNSDLTKHYTGWNETEGTSNPYYCGHDHNY